MPNIPDLRRTITANWRCAGRPFFLTVFLHRCLDQAMPITDLDKRWLRAVVEARRQPRKSSAARQRYAKRRKRWLCTACGRPSGGTSRCEPCARKSWARSEHVRGLPLYPPGYTVVDAVEGETLETFESWEDAVLYLSIEGLQFQDVEVLVDRSPMATLTAAPWE